MQPLPSEKDDDIIFTIRTLKLSKKIMPKFLDFVNQFVSQITNEDLSENVEAEIKVVKSSNSLGHSVYLKYSDHDEKEPLKEFSSMDLQENKISGLSKKLRYEDQDNFAMLPMKKIRRDDSIPSSYQNAVNSPSLVMLPSPYSKIDDNLFEEEEEDFNFQSLQETNKIKAQLFSKEGVQPIQKNYDWGKNASSVDVETNYITNLIKGSLINEEEADSLVKKRNEEKPKLSKENNKNVKKAKFTGQVAVVPLSDVKNTNQQTEEFINDVRIQISPLFDGLETSFVEENDPMVKISQSPAKSEASEIQKDFGSPVMVYVENEQTAIEDLRSPSYDNEEDEKGDFCALILSPGFDSDDKESFDSENVLIDITVANQVEWIETN